MVEKIMRTGVLIVVISLAVACLAGKEPVTDRVREPVVSDKFYPASPGCLRASIERFMQEAVPVQVKEPVAVIVPHAGYIFSGQVCADGYRQVSGRRYETVVILGANHSDRRFEKISVYSGSAFRTPLGVAEVDRAMAAKIVEADRDCVFDDSVHEREHSVEVQVPFIQVLLPGAKVLPVVVGSTDVGLCRRFGEVLAGVVKGSRTLIVASSDLSHYPEAKDAVRVDAETLAAVVGLDAGVLHEKVGTLMKSGVENLVTCACGEGPIMAAMEAAKALGARGGAVVSYHHSGDIPIGEGKGVVGYAAVALGEKRALKAREKTPDASAPLFLFPSDKKTLLAFARKSIARFMETRTLPLARGFDPRLSTPRGVFVTLMKRGELRGCIGHVPPDTPLVNLVGAMAVKAAFGDPRFEPLGEEELDTVEIEISLLTKPKDVGGVGDVVIGRDGVILQKEGRAALFLPQVAPQQGWGREETLEHLCLKAGLEKWCWKEGAKLSTFQAVVFGEKGFR
ncbi:MAG: AmmeMemoRadiSam system protein B [Syntrophobacterales bacterium]|jgi:AmmeMemoRadiSam system protein B/AmmeMemoRadiSam system protein A|nr:AmmeMemoRadiSam system protein B [Syntrophobacterales bacterium]